MENSNTLQIKQKLMDTIKSNVSLLQNGCYRDICYNKYCAKSKRENFGTPQQITYEAIRLAKESKDIKCLDLNSNSKIVQYSVETRRIDINSKFENLTLNFVRQELPLFSSLDAMFVTGLNFDFSKLKSYFSVYKGLFKKIDEIDNINHYLSENSFIMQMFEDESENEDLNRLRFYLYYLLSRMLIYVCLHPYFGFDDYYSKGIRIFFEYYLKVYRRIRKSNKSLLSIFSDIPVDIFLEIINTFQSNISIYFLMEVNQTIQGVEKSLIFLKIFKIFYKINERFKFTKFTDFNNETLNSEDRKELKIMTIKTYSKKLKRKEKIPCLLDYPWIFDSNYKNDVIYFFNTHKQKEEMMNSIFRETSSLSNLSSLMNLENNIYLCFEIRRDNIVEDTLNLVSNPTLNFKKGLKVKFHGEVGVDQGGVKKEFFLLLTRQLFDIQFGMFNYDEKSRLFWFNPFSFETSMKFELIGILIGLAIFNNVILDIKFPLVVYKKLLDFKTSLLDLKDINEEHYRSLKFIKEYKEDDLEEKLNINFVVIAENFGEKIQIPLKQNGENIYVNQSNKNEYIDLYLDWYFNTSIQHLFKNFRHGFYRVCDEKALKLIKLKPEELELIICGSVNLDFIELQKAARYDDGYTKDSTTIRLMWEVLHEMKEEDKKKFLFFTTGCDRAPINGLGSLVITISKGGPDSDKLPSAHTCFNHLIIPDYQNKEKLKERLYISINNSEGFGLM